MLSSTLSTRLAGKSCLTALTKNSSAVRVRNSCLVAAGDRHQIRMASSTTATRNTMLKLNTGASMPAMGFGTWQDKDEQANAVATAIKCGFRHIDTARLYGTEAAVGEGIRRAGVPRSELFVTTKLWNNSHEPTDVEPALDASLADLGLDYIDLFLMHWPSPFKAGDELMPRDPDGKLVAGTADYVDTYKAIEECQRKGKTRAIGVSNFSRAEMERLLKETDVVPAMHQIEQHPWLQQAAFSAWHAERGIVVTQYSPFGNSNPIYDASASMGKLIDDPTLAQIGEKYGKSGAQVTLAWGIAHGRSVIPKSKTESRIRANLEGDFELEQADVRRIDGLDRKLRLNDPSKAFKWDFFRDLDGKK